MKKPFIYLKLSFSILLFFLLQRAIDAQCYEDRHSMTLDAGWISCEKTDNPNPLRPPSHWIQYDFGEIYTLGSSKIWNINQSEKSNMGMQEVAIDYSDNGVDWVEWGTYVLDRAVESSFYEGQDGPDFEGIATRYLLITGLTNYGASCYGLNEIRIETSGIVSSVVDNVIEGFEINASPIPFDQYFAWSLDAELEGSHTYRIINALGEVVVQGDIRTNELKRVETYNWPSGSYFINVSIGTRVLTKSISLVRS